LCCSLTIFAQPLQCPAGTYNDAQGKEKEADCQQVRDYSSTVVHILVSTPRQ
jgi:hypothetical protein